MALDPDSIVQQGIGLSSTHIKILHTRDHFQSQLECCGLILKVVITKTITRVLWTVR